MKQILILALLTFVASSAIPKVPKEAKLYFTDYVQYFGYPVETHYVTTDDGYILKLFRIQAKNSTIKTGKSVVLLQHGLLDCSDTWIINDESKAPAFFLANNQYDVWLGNTRGNKHSRNHTTLDPESFDFWQFTYQDMGEHDIPAMFKYINQVTNLRINYIGHSQGTMQMFIALSEHIPVVRNNILKYIAMGPVAYIRNVKFNRTEEMVKEIAEKFFTNHTEIGRFMDLFAEILHDVSTLKEEEVLSKYLKVPQELLPQNELITDKGTLFCTVQPELCGKIIGALTSTEWTLDNYYRFNVLAGHDPAGTSLKNMIHFAQLFVSDKYQKFNYGVIGNLEHYRRRDPPVFDLGKIDVPVYLFVGNEDKLADVTDAERLKSELTGSPKVWWKQYEAGHCSFLWGMNMGPVLNDMLMILENRQVETFIE